jgi:hypothetical protein
LSLSLLVTDGVVSYNGSHATATILRSTVLAV